MDAASFFERIKAEMDDQALLEPRASHAPHFLPGATKVPQAPLTKSDVEFAEYKEDAAGPGNTGGYIAFEEIEQFRPYREEERCPLHNEVKINRMVQELPRVLAEKSYELGVCFVIDILKEFNPRAFSPVQWRELKQLRTLDKRLLEYIRVGLKGPDETIVEYAGMYCHMFFTNRQQMPKAYLNMRVAFENFAEHRNTKPRMDGAIVGHLAWAYRTHQAYVRPQAPPPLIPADVKLPVPQASRHDLDVKPPAKRQRSESAERPRKRSRSRDGDVRSSMRRSAERDSKPSRKERSRSRERVGPNERRRSRSREREVEARPARRRSRSPERRLRRSHERRSRSQSRERQENALMGSIERRGTLSEKGIERADRTSQRSADDRPHDIRSRPPTNQRPDIVASHLEDAAPRTSPLGPPAPPAATVIETPFLNVVDAGPSSPPQGAPRRSNLRTPGARKSKQTVTFAASLETTHVFDKDGVVSPAPVAALQVGPPPVIEPKPPTQSTPTHEDNPATYGRRQRTSLAAELANALAVEALDNDALEAPAPIPDATPVRSTTHESSAQTECSLPMTSSQPVPSEPPLVPPVPVLAGHAHVAEGDLAPPSNPPPPTSQAPSQQPTCTHSTEHASTVDATPSSLYSSPTSDGVVAALMKEEPLPSSTQLPQASGRFKMHLPSNKSRNVANHRSHAAPKKGRTQSRVTGAAGTNQTALATEAPALDVHKVEPPHNTIHATTPLRPAPAPTDAREVPTSTQQKVAQVVVASDAVAASNAAPAVEVTVKAEPALPSRVAATAPRLDMMKKQTVQERILLELTHGQTVVTQADATALPEANVMARDATAFPEAASIANPIAAPESAALNVVQEVDELQAWLQKWQTLQGGQLDQAGNVPTAGAYRELIATLDAKVKALQRHGLDLDQTNDTAATPAPTTSFRHPSEFKATVVWSEGPGGTFWPAVLFGADLVYLFGTHEWQTVDADAVHEWVGPRHTSYTAGPEKPALKKLFVDAMAEATEYVASTQPLVV